MDKAELIVMLDSLPADKRKVIEDLVISLSVEAGLIKKPRMKFGDLKGLLTHLADDFDKP